MSKVIIKCPHCEEAVEVKISTKSPKLYPPAIKPGIYGNYRVISKRAPKGSVYAFDLVGDDRAASTEFEQLIPLSWLEGIKRTPTKRR